MARDYERETQLRVAYIRAQLAQAGATGIAYGNSGGKDCALVAQLCALACSDVLGIIMPCGATRNYTADTADALALGEWLKIPQRQADLAPAQGALLAAAGLLPETAKTAAVINIAPRLRMATLYAVAANENRLVAGTGNRSERHVGYFTKWGDGAFDFNPIADLTVTEVYAYLRYFGAPAFLLEKPPSAGLYEGQTDEADMGCTYADIDAHLFGREILPQAAAIIERYHRASGHKRALPSVYMEENGKDARR